MDHCEGSRHFHEFVYSEKLKDTNRQLGSVQPPSFTAGSVPGVGAGIIVEAEEGVTAVVAT